MPDADKERRDGLKLSMIVPPGGQSKREQDFSAEPDAGQQQHWQRGQFNPPPGEPVNDYTEYVEEHGITGFRILGRIIDWFTIYTVASFAIAPFQFFIFFNRISDLVEETPADSNEFPTEFFGFMFVMWGVMFALMFLLSTLYFSLLEHRYGKTLGKKAFGLQVLNETGGRPTGKQLLARGALSTLSMFLYFWIVELIVMAVREDGRTLTDLFCGTKVIRIRRVYNYQHYWQGQWQR